MKNARLWEFVQRVWDKELENEDLVREFITNSKYGELEQFTVNGQPFELTLKTVGKMLQLPTTGRRLSTIEKLKPEQLIEVFQENARSSAGNLLTKAKYHWEDWFKFINQQFFFNTKQTHMSDQKVAAAVLAWEGAEINWGQILLDSLKAELYQKRNRNPLISSCQFYIEALCRSAQPQTPYNIPGVVIRNPYVKERDEQPARKRMKKTAVRPPTPKLEETAGASSSQTEIPNTRETTPEDLPLEDRLKRTQAKEKNLKDCLQLSTERESAMEKLLQQEKKKWTDEKKLLQEEFDQVQTNAFSIQDQLTEEKKALEEQVRLLREKLEEKEQIIRQQQITYKEQQTEFDRARELLSNRKDCDKQARIDAAKEKKRADQLEQELKKHQGKGKTPLEPNPEDDDWFESVKKELDAAESKVQELAALNDQLHDANDQLKEDNITRTRQIKQMKKKCWDFELRSPPSFSLFRAYELQREVCREILSLSPGEIHSPTEFNDIWKEARDFEGMHDLLCEMVIRGDLLLTTFKTVFIPIPNWGARALLFYLKLEQQLSKKRTTDVATQYHREVTLIDYETELREVLEKAEPATIEKWRHSVDYMHDRLKGTDLVQSTANYVEEREQVAQRGEITLSYYVYNIERVKVQLKEMLDQLQEKKIYLGSSLTVAQLPLPPPTYIPATAQLTRFTVGGSSANQRYLGNYEALFRTPGEQPLPSWAAMDWLMEDYGYNREEVITWDKAYKKLEADFQVNPPAAVLLNGHFCKQCNRRYKWDPKATINSVEYNWPQIPGLFDTPAHCADAYEAFFQIHKDHTDPVCFRAAVFCKFLAYFCRGHRVLCNVNEFSILRPEIHILIKLQYRCARWMRMVEVMTTTHFFFGGHSCLVNEFTTKERGYQNEHATRLRAIDNFLDTQRRQNYHMAVQDDELCKELHSQDKRRYLQDQRRADEQRNRGQPRRY